MTKQKRGGYFKLKHSLQAQNTCTFDMYICTFGEINISWIWMPLLCCLLGFCYLCLQSLSPGDHCSVFSRWHSRLMKFWPSDACHCQYWLSGNFNITSRFRNSSNYVNNVNHLSDWLAPFHPLWNIRLQWDLSIAFCLWQHAATPHDSCILSSSSSN